MSHVHEINGELLKLRREERGWAQSDLASRACMSIKQIRQLEEGGVSAFYSESVKLSAAKKVADLLGLSVDQLWVLPESPVEPESVQESAPSEPAQQELKDGASPHNGPVKETGSEESNNEKSETQTHQPISPEPETKNKTSLWLIASLFGAALAVAAYMRPDAESVSTEPPPPLQAVPSEAVEPASGASAAVDAASAPASEAMLPKAVASVPVAPPSLATSKPTAMPASVMVSEPKPLGAASAVSPARPASAVVIAPAASK